MAALMSRYVNVAARTLPDKIVAALEQQTVEVPGPAGFGGVTESLPRRLLDIHRDRRAITAALKEKLDPHPVAQIITTLPSIGVNGAARLLVAIGDASPSRTADQ